MEMSYNAGRIGDSELEMPVVLRISTLEDSIDRAFAEVR